ncbi:hypothetical protein BH23GEM11_BH23GEM11_07670 [soil metagenome]
MKPWSRTIPALALVLGLAACDAAPTEPAEPPFDADVEFFLAEAGTPERASRAERATAAVAHAHGILERATFFVSEHPSDEADRILALARSGCDAADGAFEAERWVAAAQNALRCATGARMAVLQARADRAGPLEARAEQAVERAGELVAQAAGLVDTSTPPRAAQVLAEAEGHLAEARRALEAGQFRAAIARAVRAGMLAQRIIQVLG